MAIKDYSTTPDMNTTISGINIAEGCAPSGINNAIRQLMADVKAEKDAQNTKDSQQDTAIAGKLDKSGGALSGSIVTSVGDTLLTNSDALYLRVTGGTTYHNGAYLLLAGKDHSYGGRFQLAAQKETDAPVELRGEANGSLTWGGVSILTAGMGSLITAGTVIALAGNPSSAPSGFLLCNGAAVSRTTYAALFSAIGTTYGTGNGSSTFNLPNLTDKFIQGSGTAGTVKEAGLPNIKTESRYMSAIFTDNQANAVLYSGNESGAVDSGGSKIHKINFDASRGNAIYGASTTVQPPALTMRYYIKY